MKVLVTGGTGLIGSKLTDALEARGDDVLVVSRSKKGNGYIRWDPLKKGSLAIPDDTDAVVHLAGAPLFGERWSKDYKQTIRRSRVEGTRTVVHAIEESDADIRNFISSSAVGYYGNRGDEQLTEESSPGEDFLADVCVEWEEEARKIEAPEPAIIRTGVVLSTEGGALQRMLNPFPGVWPFHWGLGGPLGFRARQFMPWIHIEDEIRAILHILDNELSGTFNLSAPTPVRNKDYTKALGATLNRPAFFPLPYFIMYLLYGEAAGVLYASQRVLPEALEESGYDFHYETVENALEDLLS